MHKWYSSVIKKKKKSKHYLLKLFKDKESFQAVSFMSVLCTSQYKGVSDNYLVLLES